MAYSASSNRTKLELKRMDGSLALLRSQPSNRTKLELKPASCKCLAAASLHF